MTTSAAGQRYWLGDSPPEISHLLAQAEFLAPDAAGLLDRIGVAPGRQRDRHRLRCAPAALPGRRQRAGWPDWISSRDCWVSPASSAQHGHLGRRTARLLRDAGLRDVEVRVLARLTAPGKYFHTFLLTLVVLLRRPATGDGPPISRHTELDDRRALRWQAPRQSADS